MQACWKAHQARYFPIQWLLYLVGGYYVQKEKKMVLDVPDLTGFKVALSASLLCVAQALCCVLDSFGEVLFLFQQTPSYCFFIAFIVSAILCAFTFHWKS